VDSPSRRPTRAGPRGDTVLYTTSPPSDSTVPGSSRQPAQLVPGTRAREHQGPVQAAHRLRCTTTDDAGPQSRDHCANPYVVRTGRSRRNTASGATTSVTRARIPRMAGGASHQEHELAPWIRTRSRVRPPRRPRTPWRSRHPGNRIWTSRTWGRPAHRGVHHRTFIMDILARWSSRPRWS